MIVLMLIGVLVAMLVCWCLDGFPMQVAYDTRGEAWQFVIARRNKS